MKENNNRKATPPPPGVNITGKRANIPPKFNLSDNWWMWLVGAVVIFGVVSFVAQPRQQTNLLPTPPTGNSSGMLPAFELPAAPATAPIERTARPTPTMRPTATPKPSPSPTINVFVGLPCMDAKKFVNVVPFSVRSELDKTGASFSACVEGVVSFTAYRGRGGANSPMVVGILDTTKSSGFVSVSDLEIVIPKSVRDAAGGDQTVRQLEGKQTRFRGRATYSALGSVFTIEVSEFSLI